MNILNMSNNDYVSNNLNNNINTNGINVIPNNNNTNPDGINVIIKNNFKPGEKEEKELLKNVIKL